MTGHLSRTGATAFGSCVVIPESRVAQRSRADLANRQPEAQLPAGSGSSHASFRLDRGLFPSGQFPIF